VVLLSNAPRMPSELLAQFARIGVPPDCFDAIVTSGGAARADLAARAERARSAGDRIRVYLLGPESDLSIAEGLEIERTGIDEAQIVLCVGLVNDLVETPEDYAAMLARMRARNLTMICANPDMRVHRGAKLVWCAGALALAYEKLGGDVVYYGKPHLPIYQSARRAAGAATNPLAIGDGLMTDIRGAGAAGIDALFIADGVHGEDVEPYTREHIAHLFAGSQVSARAAMRSLVW
jgi:HAD superfamily hydrolase (TIGR01459 family)